MLTGEELLKLRIDSGRLLSPEGETIAWIDYGRNYIYVCFYRNKMVLAEYNTLDSVLIRLTRAKIKLKYYYAFRILCAGGVTAVIKWIEDDIALVGITSGYYENGERIWTPAKNLRTWPGKKEIE
jgi:hypothetical protein